MNVETIKVVLMTIFQFIIDALEPVSFVAVIAASVFGFITFGAIRKQASLEILKILLAQRYSDEYI